MIFTHSTKVDFRHACIFRGFCIVASRSLHVNRLNIYGTRTTILPSTIESDSEFILVKQSRRPIVGTATINFTIILPEINATCYYTAPISTQ